jgi:hypothetical protein
MIQIGTNHSSITESVRFERRHFEIQVAQAADAARRRHAGRRGGRVRRR